MKQKYFTKQNQILIRESTAEDIDQCADICFKSFL